MILPALHHSIRTAPQAPPARPPTRVGGRPIRAFRTWTCFRVVSLPASGPPLRARMTMRIMAGNVSYLFYNVKPTLLFFADAGIGGPAGAGMMRPVCRKLQFLQQSRAFGFIGARSSIVELPRSQQSPGSYRLRITHCESNPSPSYSRRGRGKQVSRTDCQRGRDARTAGGGLVHL